MSDPLLEVKLAASALIGILCLLGLFNVFGEFENVPVKIILGVVAFFSLRYGVGGLFVARLFGRPLGK